MSGKARIKSGLPEPWKKLNIRKEVRKLGSQSHEGEGVPWK